MKPATLHRLMDAQKAKKAAVLLRFGESGEHVLWIDGVWQDGFEADEDLEQQRANAVRLDRSQMIETAKGPAFLQVFNPDLRLIVVGAVHITQALVTMARLSGYDVTVIDPRRAFATEARFPGTILHHDWPDEVLQDMRPDHRTAFVTLTHDPKIDDPALTEALRSPAFYIAALGSKRTHAARVLRLREEGFSDHDIDRIHGPAGFDIGAVSPSEIAVSVMAEMTHALRRGAVS